MTDVFISYAHEDQAFARRIAQGLEAEGLSVWWDHTIPPGKTWDTFIAKGIADARCCIVLWSAHSVDSDWVKEEATLAKEGGKYLPAQIDTAQPPVGFRRIQAALLQRWRDDSGDPQWQMLVREARAMVGKPISATPTAPVVSSTPATGARPPWAAFAGLGIAAVITLAAFAVLNQQRDVSFEEAPAAEATPVEAAPAEAVTAEPFDASGSAELERMRRERDEAIAAARNQQAENERIRREQASAPASANAPAVISLTCRYATGSIPSFSGPGNPNSSGAYDFRPNGVVGAGQGTRWSQTGANATFDDNRGYTYRGTITGNRFAGRAIDRNGVDVGSFDLEISASETPNCQ